MLANCGSEDKLFCVMRLRFSILCAAVIAVLMCGCKVQNTIPEKTTAGSGYDVVVLCDDALWAGDVSTAVSDVLELEAPGLTRPQGYFTIVKHVAANMATDVDKKYPNILALSVNPTVEEPSYSVSRNVYARPQTVVVVTAPDGETMASYLVDVGQQIRDVMEEGERRRDINFSSARPADQLMAYFKEFTGLEMVIPANFYKATTADEELLWFIRDYPNKAQYIFAFTMPYDAANDDVYMRATEALRAIDDKFNTISSKGAEGSFMRISEQPMSCYVTDGVDVNGRQWLEIRDWWEVANDFMGGPFVAYVYFDEANSQAKVIIFALYAPEDPQRNLLRELEHLIYTVK